MGDSWFFCVNLLLGSSKPSPHDCVSKLSSGRMVALAGSCMGNFQNTTGPNVDLSWKTQYQSPKKGHVVKGPDFPKSTN